MGWCWWEKYDWSCLAQWILQMHTVRWIESLLEINLYREKGVKTRLDRGKTLIAMQDLLYRYSACENCLSVCPIEAEMAGLVYPDPLSHWMWLPPNKTAVCKWCRPKDLEVGGCLLTAQQQLGSEQGFERPGWWISMSTTIDLWQPFTFAYSFGELLLKAFLSEENHKKQT